MFTEALFTTPKIWKQHKCPLTDEWDKKNVIHTHTHTHIYIHNGILLSHKKEWNIAISSNMDGPRDYHTKWSKLDKDKYISHIWDLKNDTYELIYKRETDSQT